jgi:hypothetical protein
LIREKKMNHSFLKLPVIELIQATIMDSPNDQAGVNIDQLSGSEAREMLANLLKQPTGVRPTIGKTFKISIWENKMLEFFLEPVCCKKQQKSS